VTFEGYKHRKLLILRHGKSDWSKQASDFDRPLKKRGVIAAGKIGYWISNHRGLKPDLILTSPARRALSTATIVADMMGKLQPQVDDRIYESGLDKMLMLISEIPDKINCPMIVGHNPCLEELLLHLADVPKSYYMDWKLLTTGTLAIVKFPFDWNLIRSEKGRFKDLIRGRDL
jgi:phosphohistidine phosphatase